MNIFIKFFNWLKSLFLHGFFTVLPITATIVVVNFGYQVVANWIAPLRRFAPYFMQHIPGAEFIIVVTLVLSLGALLKLFILSPLVHYLENLINRIPLIRIIYSSAKILVDFFNVPNPATVRKKVVLIEFPRKGVYNIAFLLDSAENNFAKVLPKEKTEKSNYFKVFMPNSPNPTSGFFFVLPEEDIIPTNITFEEAIKTIVSCGINTPGSLSRLRVDKEES